MSPADLIKLPEAVSRAALLTELALLESISAASSDIDRLRGPFIQYLVDHQVPRPVYNRTTSSFGGFLRETVQDGLVESDAGAFRLTPAGRSRLEELRKEARELSSR